MMMVGKAVQMMIVLIKECVQMDIWTLLKESIINGLAAKDALVDRTQIGGANVLVKRPHPNANCLLNAIKRNLKSS